MYFRIFGVFIYVYFQWISGCVGQKPALRACSGLAQAVLAGRAHGGVEECHAGVRAGVKELAVVAEQ